MSQIDPNKIVTVCASCRRASCWHGEHYCWDYQTAGTIELKRSELDALALEHPSNYSDDKLSEVYGA